MELLIKIGDYIQYFSSELFGDGFLTYMLTGDFGLLTITPAYLFFILFPIVVIFNFFLTSIDACGLMSRISLKLDTPLRKMGLSSNMILPFFLGFGCVTVALATLSTMKNKRERVVTSAILCIIVPCSSQVAIIAALSFLLSPKYIIFYFMVIILTFILLSIFLSKLLIKGTLLEKLSYSYTSIPSLSLPDFKKIFCDAVHTGITFLKETCLPFFIGSAVVSSLIYCGFFSFFCSLMAPFTSGFLHLSNEAAGIFMLSILKRDLGAAGFLSVISQGGFKEAELVVTLIVMTLFVPCVSSFIVLIKQEKLPAAILIWAGSFCIALSIGKIASLLLIH